MFANTRKIALKFGAVAAPLALVSKAHAALPAEAATAITQYQTDALAAIGLTTTAGVIIWGALKLASKLGWR